MDEYWCHGKYYPNPTTHRDEYPSPKKTLDENPEPSERDKKMITSDKINLWGIILAFGISLLSLFYSIHQGEKVEILNTKINSLSYNPKLVVFKKPVIGSITIDSMAININDEYLDTTLSSRECLITNAILSFDVEISIINMGNSEANLICVALCDTTSDTDILRDIALDKRRFSHKEYGFIPFFHAEILHNCIDTVDIKNRFTITFIENELFTLHFWLLYENEIGDLFDTYYWVQYKVGDIAVPILRVDDKVVAYKRKTNVPIKNIEFCNDNSSYKPYFEKKIIKQIKKKLYN